MVVDPDASKSFIMLGLIVVLYFLPLFVASLRGHPNTISISLLNLFLGWTGLGWLAALIWSASSISKEAIVASPPPKLPDQQEDHYQRLEKLANLKERGHLTDEEFEVEKAKLLKG